MGRYNSDEIAFVKEHGPKLPLSDIATILGKSQASIKQLAKAEGVTLKGEKKKGETEDDPNSPAFILRAFRAKPYYKDLYAQLSRTEMASFEAQWIDIVRQFDNNILASEELELKELLMYETLKNRCMTEEREILDTKTSVVLQLGTLEAIAPDAQTDDEKRLVRTLQADLVAIGSRLKDTRKTFETLSEKCSKVRQSLTNARSKRTQDFDRAKIDFTELLKALQDWEFRKRFAKETEILKEAKNKAYRDLTELHEYGTAKVPDYPILNSEVVLDEGYNSRLDAGDPTPDPDLSDMERTDDSPKSGRKSELRGRKIRRRNEPPEEHIKRRGGGEEPPKE